MTVRSLLRQHIIGSSFSSSRRDWLKQVGVTGLGTMALRQQSLNADDRPQQRSCIVLWMSGGASQIDTFDLKPGHAHGGPFREIQTTVPGIRISEHLPKMAQRSDRLAILRSMSTQEGDHGRAISHLHKGYQEQASIEYPSLGALVAHEHQSADVALPNYVSIGSSNNGVAARPGFLGSKFAPLVLEPVVSINKKSETAPDQTQLSLGVENLRAPKGLKASSVESRAELLQFLNREFAGQRRDVLAQSYTIGYQRAIRLMNPAFASAFDLEHESAAMRQSYGEDLFGQGCLLARRLVERGVKFVEVNLSLGNGALNWDTHSQNFPRVQELCALVDRAWSQLIEDLADRGLLEQTLIVWMGEFGRTPKINRGEGRDHFPNAWTTVLAGGGIQGGQVVGRTSDDGMTVEDRPISVPDFMATVCTSLGIDTAKNNVASDGQPIRVVDGSAKLVNEVLPGKRL